MSVGNKIIYNFPRPAKELVEQFRGMPVANIDDNMGRIAAVDSAIVPINSSPLVGTAFTAVPAASPALSVMVRSVTAMDSAR